MKRWLIVVLSVFGTLAVGFVVVVFFARSTSSWARNLAWEEPELEQISDGHYEGSARLTMPPGTAAANTTATVRVTIRDHRYEAIEVVSPERIAEGMTRYAQIVVDRQSTRPDTISGATVTKTVVLMAAADALEDD